MARKPSKPKTEKTDKSGDAPAENRDAVDPAQSEPVVIEAEAVGVPDTPEAEDDATLPAPEGETPEQDAEAPQSKEPDMPPETPPRAQPARRGGLVALALGGLLAGAIGFAMGKIDPQATWPFADTAGELASLRSGLSEAEAARAAQADRIAALEEQLAQTGDKLSELDGISQKIAENSAAIETLSARAEQFARRITDLENRPIPDVGATQEAVAAYERELAAMRQMLAEELDKIERAQQEAAALKVAVVDTGRAAAIRAALTQLRFALSSGADLSPALDQLRSADVEIPDVLAQGAGTTPSLAALTEAYPDAAREALAEATRAMAERGEIGRIEAFFRVQLGARSLEPRPGDDPDAILARAEAALKAGDVAQALAELDGLPELQAPKLASWRADAQAYLDVANAVYALEQSLLGGESE